MKKYLPILITGLLLIKGAIALSTEVALIEFREGSSTVDYFVSPQLERVYETLPLQGEVELVVVSDHDIMLHYNNSSMNSRHRCQSIGRYYREKGVPIENIKVTTYRQRTYVETVGFHAFQEFGATLIFRIKLSKAKKNDQLVFTHSGADPFIDFCESRTFNGTEANTIFHSKGVSIQFPAYAFESISGNAVSFESIDIQICAYLDKSDFLLVDITSNAGKRWLESGGMIHIEAYASKEKLRLKKNTKAVIYLENLNLLKKDMRVFEGKKQHGIVDWIPATSGIVSTKEQETESYLEDSFMSDEEYEEELTEEELYNAGLQGYLMKVSNLGWINCDRFMDLSKPTELLVKVNGGSKDLAVRLVFKDINAVIPGYNYNDAGAIRFESLPSNTEASLVVFGKQNGKPVWARKDIQLGRYSSVEIDPVFMSDDEVKKEMLQFAL